MFFYLLLVKCITEYYFHTSQIVRVFMLQANLGFLKVLVAKSQAEGLQMHLKNMVDCLLMWQDNTKNHFKAKVGVLVVQCGHLFLEKIWFHLFGVDDRCFRNETISS